MSTNPLITQMDAALARYYALHKVTYMDEDGIGKFEAYCNENGLDDDATIEEELQQDDPDESLIIDFDEDFPGLDSNDKKRAYKIFAILQNCAENETAFIEKKEEKEESTIQITMRDWEISSRDIEKITKIHKQQCPTIFDGKFEQDKSILRLLSVGYKLDVPYLQWLTDMYQRERVDSKDVVITYGTAIFAVSNKHCNELKNIREKSYAFLSNIEDKTPLDDATIGITSFFHRICPQLMFQPPKIIIDSLSQTCEYIAGSIDFVAGLASTAKKTCPFQFDVTIAFNKTKEGTPAFSPDTQVDVDSDDEDDDDDDEIEEKDKFYDVFGNVKEKFKAEKLLFTTTELNDENDIDEKDNNFIYGGKVTKAARIFNGQFNTFKSEQVKKKYENIEFEEYPRKHRFCVFIDRRDPDDADNKNDKDIVENDEVIFYEPPDNCNTFPDEKHMPMYYFDTSRTCIIPNIGYNNGKKNFKQENNENLDYKERVLSETITCSSGCNGAILVLSFHVESVDEIKCYLYINGQILRFFPSDIITVLPEFFDKEFGDNEKFPDSTHAQLLVKQMTKKLKDVKFKAFLKKYQATPDDIIETKARYQKFMLF